MSVPPWQITMLNKTSLRNFLGELPLAAELDYVLRQKNRVRKDHYNLSLLGKSLPVAVSQVIPFAQKAKPGKKILFFAALHYWIEKLRISLLCSQVLVTK